MENAEVIKKTRNSSIEILKIIGMILIIFSHTFTAAHPFLSEASFAEQFISGMLHCLGHIGNLMFFIPTCWFLIDKEEMKGVKVINLLLDLFVIASMVSPLTLLLKGEYLPFDIGLILSSNWYVIAYIAVYLLHPILNKGLANISEEVEEKIIFAVFLLNFVFTFLTGVSLAVHGFSLVLIYLMIHFLKVRRMKWLDSKKFNLILFGIGVIGYVITVLLVLNGENYFYTLNNPFYLFIALPVFNFVRKREFYSKTINWISSLSLFVYIFGENQFWIVYGRKHIFEQMIGFGMSNIILDGLIIACGSIVLYFSLAALYKISISKVTKIVSCVIAKQGEKIRKRIFKSDEKDVK